MEICRNFSDYFLTKKSLIIELVAFSGCDSIVTQELIVNEVDATVTVKGTTIVQIQIMALFNGWIATMVLALFRVKQLHLLHQQKVGITPLK